MFGLGALMNSLYFSLLHLIEHGRKCVLHVERFLDLVGADERIFAVFKEAGTMMLAYEAHERVGIGLPILRKTFEVFKYCVQPRACKDRDGVLGVFVEIRVEYSDVLKISVALDIEEVPAQVVKLQH